MPGSQFTLPKPKEAVRAPVDIDDAVRGCRGDLFNHTSESRNRTNIDNAFFRPNRRFKSYLKDFGDLRLRAAYSQGGVDLERIPRTTSWIVYENDPMHFSTLNLGPQFASAPPSVGGHHAKVDSPPKRAKYSRLPERPNLVDRMGHQSPEDQVEADGLTKCQVVIYLVTAIIGCGVVVLPSLMAIGGWVVVPAIAGVTSLAFMEIGKVMDSALSCAERKSAANKRFHTFEDLGEAAMGRFGVSLIRTVTGTGFSGTLIVYTMLIGQNLHGLLGRQLPMEAVMMIVTPILIFLALLKDGTLANIMSVGMLASLSSCVLICIKGLQDAQIWQSWPKDKHLHVHSMWPTHPAALGTVLACLFSAFSVVGTVPCIRGQMKDPTDFLPAFHLSLWIVLAMYWAVMLSGYWGYGNFVQHNVVDSMMFPPRTPQEAMDSQETQARDNVVSNPIGVLMAVLVTTYLFLGFSLFFKCILGMMQKLLHSRSREGSLLNFIYEEGTWGNSILRSLLVIMVVLIGLAVPHFRDIMAIMSSVCCSCNNVFFPLLFAMKLEPPGSATRSHLRRLCHLGIVLLGVFCFCLGLWSSLSNLVREMGHHQETQVSGTLLVPSTLLPHTFAVTTTLVPRPITGATRTFAPGFAAAGGASGFALTDSTAVTTMFMPASTSLMTGFVNAGVIQGR